MSGFYHIRLELAREPGHPHGDAGSGWDLVAALDDQGRLDLEACRAESQRCRIRRFHHDVTVATGHLRHAADDRWTLDLHEHDTLDATEFSFGEERFLLGECVTLIAPDGKPHSYGVERVQPA